MGFIGEVEQIVTVNKKNEVTGHMPDNNRYAHPDVITRGSVVLIFDEQGKLLLQRRSRHKYSYPGYWCSSAGGVTKVNQSCIDCALEELEEEVGLQVTADQLEDKGVHYIEHQVKEFVHVYVLHHPHFEPEANWEVVETRWQDVTEIQNMLAEGEPFTPVVLAAIAHTTGVKL